MLLEDHDCWPKSQKPHTLRSLEPNFIFYIKINVSISVLNVFDSEEL